MSIALFGIVELQKRAKRTIDLEGQLDA